MIIRSLEKRDIEQCVNIVNENWNGEIGDSELDLNLSLSSLNIPRKPFFYVLTEDDYETIIGFIGFQFSPITLKNSIDLFLFNVKKEFQGKGLGTYFLKNVINIALEKDIFQDSQIKNVTILLSCESKYKEFYEKNNFVPLMYLDNFNYLMARKEFKLFDITLEE